MSNPRDRNLKKNNDNVREHARIEYQNCEDLASSVIDSTKKKIAKNTEIVIAFGFQ